MIASPALLVAACDSAPSDTASGGSGAGASGGGTSAGGGGGGPCTGSGCAVEPAVAFADFQDWATPALEESSRGYFETWFATHDWGYWGTLDIDGDGRADLVDTAPPGPDGQHGGTGDPHWRVHMNGGGAFATSAVSWPTPLLEGSSRRFFTPSHSADDWGYWSTLDIDGDGRPDLVNTAPIGNAGQYGGSSSPHWRVYRNEGNGFAKTPVTWSTPSLEGSSRGFFATGMATDDWGYWSTLDIDGDGKPDLVSTAPVGNVGQYGGSSSPHWRVYRNEGNGFAKTPVTWSTPSLEGSSRGFFATGMATDDWGYWATLDIDGDRKVDLVHTAPVGDTGQFGHDGSPHWRVHLNEGGGFAAAAATWSTPVMSGSSRGFFTAGFGNDTWGYWSTLDLDSDGRPDLVYTAPVGDAGQFGHPSAPVWRLARGVPAGN